MWKSLFLMLIFYPVFAGHHYVITAKPIGGKILSSGDKFVVTDQSITQNQQVFVKDALAFNPAVNVLPSGQPGRQTSFFIRGARSKESLVIVDGVRVNDPISGDFDFADFLTGDVESVTVLPGAHSLRYGSDAIGGVVLINTQKGHGKPKASFRGEIGNYDTHHERARFSGEHGPWQVALSASGYGSGQGTMKNLMHGQSQSDRYKNGTLTSHLGYVLTPFWDVEGGVRYSDAHVKIDSPVFNPSLGVSLPTQVSNHQYTRQLTTHVQTTGSFLKDMLEQRARVSVNKTQRNHTSADFRTQSMGQHVELSMETELSYFEGHKTVVGEVWGDERIETRSRHHLHHEGIFAQHTVTPLEGWNITGGARMDHYQKTGGHPTYRVGIDYMLTHATRLRTNVGTGFKAPLLGDLFDKTPWSLPNPHLKPEKSVSFDAGIDQGFWDEKGVLNMTFFMTRISDVFESAQQGGKFTTINRSKRLAKGIESALEIKPWKWLSVHETLTYTHARDQGVRSPGVPALKMTSQVHVSPTKETDLFVSVLQVGARKDGVTSRNLSAYTLLTVGGSVDLTESVQLFGRIENVGNKAYENVFGYGSRGRTYFMGLEAKL